MKKTTQPIHSIALNQNQLLYLNFLLISASIVLLGATLWLQNTQKGPVSSFSGYSLGTTVSMGKADMRVTNQSYSTGVSPFKAPIGKQYLIIDLNVKNTTEKPIFVLPSSDTYIKASNGKISYLTPYNLINPFRAGELLPGEMISGQLSYLVNKHDSLNFYIDSIWSGGVVVFDVR